MESPRALTPLGTPFGGVESDASSSAKRRTLGATKIAQQDLFNYGEDSRALKPSYRAPLPGTLKREKINAYDEEHTKNPLRVSPATPALRRLMEIIKSDVEKGRKLRKEKSHPDESDSGMSDIEDNPTASNFPRYGNHKPGFWIDDRVVMNYPEPPPKKKKKSGVVTMEEENVRSNHEKYGGNPEPLQVPINFFCNPNTPPISQIERSRMDPKRIAKPGPPPLLPEVAGLVAGTVKKRRATCTGPPRLKRKYTWKGGVAPKRRLGHVKQDEHEADDEDDDEESSSDDWSEESDSVLGDDSDNESEGEDVRMGGS